jgi:hypothetical protein
VSAGDRGRYLWQVLPLLWPPPARLSRCGRMSRPGAGAADFLVFPSEERAALLVPRRPWRVTAAALRHYKASAGARDRLRFRLAAIAARGGAAELLPDRIRIEPAVPGGPDGAGRRSGPDGAGRRSGPDGAGRRSGPDGAGRRSGPDGAETDIAAHLGAVLGRDVLVCLYIGAARANRKPVLQVLAPDGTVLGFAKVGVDPLTRQLVRAEAAALEQLAQQRLAHVRPPRLMYHGQWRGLDVMLQEALPAARPAGSHRDLGAAMAEIAGVRGLSRGPAAHSAYWQRLRSRLEALSPQETAGSLLAALGVLEQAEGMLTLTFGSWHGDWAPWNMTMSGGKALVWDWERFESGVPAGFDAIHYWLQGAIIRGATPPVTAAEMAVSRAVELLAPLGVEAHAAGLVAALYLAEIATRYLHDRQAEAGARLGQVDAWLLPVLMNHVRQLGGPLPAPGSR